MVLEIFGPFVQQSRTIIFTSLVEGIIGISFCTILVEGIMGIPFCTILVANITYNFGRGYYRNPILYNFVEVIIGIPFCTILFCLI